MNQIIETMRAADGGMIIRRDWRMEQMEIDVLRALQECEDHGETATMPKIADRLPDAPDAIRRAIRSLQNGPDGGLLQPIFPWDPTFGDDLDCEAYWNEVGWTRLTAGHEACRALDIRPMMPPMGGSS